MTTLDPSETRQEKAPPPELPLRAARPVAIRLRRSAVQFAVLGAAGLLAGSLAWAFVVRPELRANARERDAARVDEARGPVRPSEMVSEQPGSYDRLPADRLPEPRRLNDRPEAPPVRAPTPPHGSPSATPARSVAAEARESGLFFAATGGPSAAATSGDPASAARADYGATYNGHSLLQPLSPYEIKAGAVIPAALLTGVNTERAGPVVATVTQNVFDTVSGRHLLVPQGTRLIGRHDGDSSYGDRRAVLAWDRLLLPNGKSLVLTKEPGVDAQGAVGVRGQVDRRIGPLLVATLFAGAITTLGEIARDDHEDSSFWGDAGDAASIQAAQVGGRLIDRELDVRPSIRLRPGAPVRVLITRDLILEPYLP
jgi:type IV secretion system protein VirB10